MIQIQIGSEDDLSEIATLYSSVFSADPWNEPWTPSLAFERLHQLFSFSNSLLIVARTEQGEILGFCLGNKMNWHDSGYFELREICTNPNQRRLGIASKILKSLEEILQKQHISGIMLMTRKGSDAESFYRSKDYVENQTELILEKGLL